MRLLNQNVVKEQQINSIYTIKTLIKKAKDEDDKELISRLNEILSTVYSVDNLKIIADCSDDSIHIVDTDGIIMYLNSAFTQITGYTKEIIGKKVDELIQDGYLADIALEALRTDRSVSVAREHNIDKRTVATTASPVFGEDGIKLGVVIISRDITEVIDLKNQLNKSQIHLRDLSEEKVKRENGFVNFIKNKNNKAMIGISKETHDIKDLINRIARLDATVLITGETGTGKEIVANEIYINSDRTDKPYIKVNCSAIPANLIESELFGYERGAFTGASTSGKVGLFELANSGTILLDEIGEMPLELQSKLLRVIQQKEVTRIGGLKPIELDVRIMASTNCNLYELACSGKFRMDLYYRLNIFPINIPPLRERKEDIRVLVDYFLKIFNNKYDKNIKIDDMAYDSLNNYKWIGNVRELQNIVERIVLISDKNNTIFKQKIISILGVESIEKNVKKDMGLKEKVEELEKLELIKAFKIGKTTRKVAKMLKINQSNVVRKAKKYGIDIGDA